MGAYAKGRMAIGLCQRCGLKFLLRELVLDGYFPNIRVCAGCYDAPQSQERLVTVSDPIALWKPAPDEYLVSPPFLTATVSGGQVVLNWTSIMAPAVGNDTGGPHHGPYLSVGYEVWRIFPNSVPVTIYAGLLLHFDDGNASSTFLDSSVNAFTPTLLSGPTETTTNPAIGTGSGYFNGSSGVSYPVTVAGPLDLSSGDWTVEFWMKAGAQPQGEGNVILAYSDFNHIQLQILYNTQSGNFLNCLSQGAQAESSTSNSVPQNTWTACAVVMHNNSMACYINGVQSGQVGTRTTTAEIVQGVFSLGNQVGDTAPYTGYIDELRVTKGLALYTANYTPLAVPFTQVSGYLGVPVKIATLLNTADEFGALSIETLTYTDTAPGVNNPEYYIRGYDTHETADNG